MTLSKAKNVTSNDRGSKGSRRLNHLVEDSRNSSNKSNEAKFSQIFEPHEFTGKQPCLLQDGHAGEQKWLTQKIGGVATEGKIWKCGRWQATSMIGVTLP